MHGAFVIDKPLGMTSAAVLRRLKHAFGVKKLGHAGTLDPMATGLLVVLLGKATRLQSLYLNAEKAYAGTIRLGTGTVTDDLEGAVTEEDPALTFWSGAAEEELLAKIKGAFSGEQQQVPPQFSAVKVSGAASYRRARRGEQVELAPRSVHIEFELLEFSARDTLRYLVRCSKGTYIRSLARDIGRLLGSCAALAEIRRLQSRPFCIEQAVPLAELLKRRPEEFLIPIEQLAAALDLPRIELPEQDCRRLRFGDQSPLLAAPVRLGEARLAALFSDTQAFQGLIERQPPDCCWQIRFLMQSGAAG